MAQAPKPIEVICKSEFPSLRVLTVPPDARAVVEPSRLVAWFGWMNRQAKKLESKFEPPKRSVKYLAREQQGCSSAEPLPRDCRRWCEDRALMMLAHGKDVTIRVLEPGYFVAAGGGPDSQLAILNEGIFFECDALLLAPGDDRLDVRKIGRAHV